MSDQGCTAYKTGLSSRILFICLRQSTLGGGIIFTARPIRPSVRLLPILLARYCENNSTAFAENWHKAMKRSTLGVRRSRSHNTEIRFGGGIILDPFDRVGFQVAFLPRDAMLSADYAVARCLSLRPSVCHTLVLCIDTANKFSNFLGYKNRDFSTTISLYLGNDTSHGHSYDEMRIGNNTQAFDWYHFHSLSVNDL